VIVLAIVIALFAAAGGYYLSWVGSLPTGPIMVALAAATYVLAGMVQLVRGL
jgi:ABC-type Mn2+/Zn2+ transport system permease subunit